MNLSDKDIFEKAEAFMDFGEDGEWVHVALLIPRRKYVEDLPKHLTRDKGPLVKRNVIHSYNWKERLYELYLIRENYDLHNLDSSAFSLYLSANPRDPVKAARGLMHKFTDWFYDKDFDAFRRTESAYISSLQKKSGRAAKNWFIYDFDLDSSFERAISLIEEFRKEYPLELDWHSYKTREGGHLIIRPQDKRAFDKILDKNYKRVEWEFKPDDMIKLV